MIIMDTDNMIKFISDNICSVIDTNEIIFYIQQKKIKYSENSNGYFINLSLLKEEYIEAIYNIVKRNIIKDNISENEENIKSSGVISDEYKDSNKNNNEKNNKGDLHFKDLLLDPLLINILVDAFN